MGALSIAMRLCPVLHDATFRDDHDLAEKPGGNPNRLIDVTAPGSYLRRVVNRMVERLYWHSM